MIMEETLSKTLEEAYVKEVYDLDDNPPLGVVPTYMHAYVNRPENHGPPLQSFKREIVKIPRPKHNEVLIKVKAAGVNFNGVWAGLGQPASPTAFHGNEAHIAGSDAAGIIWEIGEGLKNNSAFKFKVGDEVIVHCGQACGVCYECMGGNPMLCDSQKIWGYETPYGSFAQYTVVQAQQILSKPSHLSWEDAGGYMLTYATVWRMLFGFSPNIVQPGCNVLVWGGSGGLGSAAIQLIKQAGGNAIAVTSNDERGEKCMELGAIGYINRKNFDCWGPLPNIRNSNEYKIYLQEVRKFGRAIWDILGKGINPDIVVEHIGEQTFPVSTYIVKPGGMVVFCGATSGFNLTIDASFVWMRQKRIQGSHFASLNELYQANKFVEQKKFKPVISKVYEWNDLPQAHEDVLNNKVKYGNIVVKL
jgi:crotonyl-CoA carboxylase/reductase